MIVRARRLGEVAFFGAVGFWVVVLVGNWILFSNVDARRISVIGSSDRLTYYRWAGWIAFGAMLAFCMGGIGGRRFSFANRWVRIAIEFIGYAGALVSVLYLVLSLLVAGEPGLKAA